MPSQKFTMGNVKGLTPAIDPTTTTDIFALDGTNFLFDVLGPKSAFGDRLLMPQPRVKPSYMQGARLHLESGDLCFHFDGDGIWQWSQSDGNYLLIYQTPDTTVIPNRWTFDYLADIMYFCHPRVGIIIYNLSTSVCEPHSVNGIATPEGALALCQCSGLLCVISSQFFYWSNPSNGMDFTPSLGGGGFQLLSDRVSGDPITVTSYTTGVIVWTTGGNLRSDFTGDVYVWRFRALNASYAPVNSFCTARVDDDTVIILDERGLFQSKGADVTPYAPLFNEYLIGYIRSKKLKIGQNMRLEWDELKRLLYVSVSFTYATTPYNKAFVYYPPDDSWGTFDSIHYGIFPVLLNELQGSTNYYGFCDSSGCVRYWNDSSSCEAPLSQGEWQAQNMFMPATLKNTQKVFNNAAYSASSSGRLTTVSKTNDIGSVAGYYNKGIKFPILPQLVGLNAMIQIGLFRPTGPTAVDETSEVLNLLIRSYTTQDLTKGTFTDLETDPLPNYDYETGTEPNTDYGVNISDSILYQVLVVGTLDGYTPWQSQTPITVTSEPGAVNYACSVSGIWHYIQISANEVGESFHILTGEITAISTGRLL